MLPANVLLFKAFNMSFINFKMASSVAVPFLKPNWFPTSKLLVFKCSFTLKYNAFSRTFDKEVNSAMGL